MTARILVIEDNPDNMELMTYLLQAYGHATLMARDGEEGLSEARREMPDLIVCDIHLPKMDGYQVIRALKSDAALRRIPIVAVTALAMVGDREKMIAAGFDSYIAKPIVPETFVAQVEEFLRPDQRSATPPSPPDEPAAAAPPVPFQPPRASVLVVDDAAVNRELLRSTLEPFGYAVIQAASVQQALELARHNAFDLVLCDLHMPDEDGWDFLRAIKAEPRLGEIPIAIVTASVWGEVDKAKAFELGACCFILRPVEISVLLREIERCVGKRAV